MPIVIAHDPVGAYMQLQAQQQMSRDQEREQSERDRNAADVYRTQMQGWEHEVEAGQGGRGQGAVEPQGASTPLVAAQIRQLEAAHSAGTISDDDYDLAKNAVQWGGKGFNPFAEKFQQGGAMQRFQQTQGNLQDQRAAEQQRQTQAEQSRQDWEGYRAKVAQAGNQVQQAARNMEIVKGTVIDPADPKFQAAQQALNDAYSRQHDLMGQMPQGIPTNAGGNPSPGGGQVPQDQDSSVRITPGGGAGGPAMPNPMQRGGGAPMLTNPVTGTGQNDTPANAPGMSGQGQQPGQLRATPRSKIRQYVLKAGAQGLRGKAASAAAQQMAQQDGYDPTNTYDDLQSQSAQQSQGPPVKRTSAPPTNGGSMQNAQMYDQAELIG